MISSWAVQENYERNSQNHLQQAPPPTLSAFHQDPTSFFQQNSFTQFHSSYPSSLLPNPHASFYHPNIYQHSNPTYQQIGESKDYNSQIKSEESKKASSSKTFLGEKKDSLIQSNPTESEKDANKDSNSQQQTETHSTTHQTNPENSQFSAQTDFPSNDQLLSSSSTSTVTSATDCVVCGDKSSGRHYGVISCEGVAKLFLYSPY